jgi:c(7)-type cytochrome triheme protein
MTSSRTTEPNLSDTVAPCNDRRRVLSFGILIGGGLCIAISLFSNSSASPLPVESGSGSGFGTMSPPFTISGLVAEATQEAGKDFSRFAHTNPSHQRLPCLLCHRRENSSPRPVRSAQHTPCAGCHAQQFAAKSGPICTICHTDVESRSHELKPFPSLKSFNMTFAHARHRNVACLICHKPATRGIALSIPSGADAHTTCYRCHSPRAQANGQDISSCSTCHKSGQHARLSTSSKAFKASFSHEQHKNQGVSCAECHKITSLAARSAQVSSPMPTEHPASKSTQSCETCHNDQRAFGIASFSSCKRCHTGPTFRF